MSYQNGGDPPLQPPTPGPKPNENPLQPTISTETNLATRDAHTHLNRLITERLSTFLHHRTNPKILELYTLALSILQTLFANFETAHDNLVARDPGTNDDPHTTHLLTLLAHLPPPALRRSQVLHDDISHCQALYDRATTKIPDRTNRHLQRDLSPNSTQFHDQLNPWLTSVPSRLQAKPHLYLAYSHVLYMALLSGGRYIRSQLASAGDEFWLPPTAVEGGTPGFAFLTFTSEEDGEDLKRGFKAGLIGFEGVLTLEERREVVAEAEGIFEGLERLVGVLDGFGAGAEDELMASAGGSGVRVLLFGVVGVVLLALVLVER